MTNENAVQPPVVPLCGADEKQFRETLWQYLETEIHPEIRKHSYLGSRLRYITFTTYGINSVKKRFARGKPVNLSESDKDKIRAAVERLYRIRNSEDERINRYAYYSEILTEILKNDNVRLAFQDNKPVIQVNFENDMEVFFFQNGSIEHEWKQIIKTTEQWRKYAEQFSKKLSEITPQIMKIKSEIPPEFYNGVQP